MPNTSKPKDGKDLLSRALRQAFADAVESGAVPKPKDVRQYRKEMREERKRGRRIPEPARN